MQTSWYDYASRWMFEDKTDSNPPRAARAYAMVAAVYYDAFIASNDGKFAYWYLRPNMLDPRITPAFAVPPFPSYPSNHSTLSTARCEVLAYLFPQHAEFIRAVGKEGGELPHLGGHPLSRWITGRRRPRQSGRGKKRRPPGAPERPSQPASAPPRRVGLPKRRPPADASRPRCAFHSGRPAGSERSLPMPTSMPGTSRRWWTTSGPTSAMPVKTDRIDARNIAWALQAGWYRVGSRQEPGDAQAAGAAAQPRDAGEVAGHAGQPSARHPQGLRPEGRQGGPGPLEQRVRELVDGDELLEQVVGPILRVRREVLERLDELHRMVLAAVKADPVCRLLMTVPGVGPVTALAFRTAVEDPTRFAKSPLVGAHFGLTPRKYASGETDRNGGITKCGDRMVRSLLCEAANVLLTRVQPLELAEALGRRGRPPARQAPRPGRRGATAGGDHASHVGRRHAVPLDAGAAPMRQHLLRNRRGATQQEIMESAQADASGRTRARRHRPTFCRCRHLAVSTNFQRLMRRPSSGPNLRRPQRRPRSEE